MKRAAAMAVVLLIAHSAGGQCLCDLNGDMMVRVNELVIGVNNALTDCAGSGATPTPTPTPPPADGCPIDFSDDNTQPGTPDCFYAGRWNQSCGAGDLETLWRGDGIEDDGELDILVIQLFGFDPGLFFGGQVTSPTSADLVGWFTQPDASDLMPSTGTVTLNESGRTLTIAPTQVPFQIDSCDFARYEGTLTDVVQPAALRIGAPRSIDRAAFARLRAARGAGAARPNFDRK